MTYCKPSQTGLASTYQAVSRRIGRLLTALDSEITAHVIDEGPWSARRNHAGLTAVGDPSNSVCEDLRAFRMLLVERLEAEGWSMSYDGGNHVKVRAPGHKRPFPKH